MCLHPAGTGNSWRDARFYFLGLSSTSMREGIVLYDKDGQEIWACPNVDLRASEEAAELVNQHLAEQNSLHGWRLGGNHLPSTPAVVTEA